MKNRVAHAWVIGALLAMRAIAAPSSPAAPDAVLALLPKLAPEAGPRAVPIFWQRTVDYRDGSTPAWLVGLGPKGARTADWTGLVNDAGEVIAVAPTEGNGFDGGQVVRLAPDSFVLALTLPAGRSISSGVRIYALDKPLRLAFTYESPPDRGAPLWNSTLYFTDVDSDGVLDLLIDRRTLLDGQRGREFKLYVYDSLRQTFHERFAAGLEEAVQAAQGNSAAPRVDQYTVAPLIDALQ